MCKRNLLFVISFVCKHSIGLQRCKAKSLDGDTEGMKLSSSVAGYAERVRARKEGGKSGGGLLAPRLALFTELLYLLYILKFFSLNLNYFTRFFRIGIFDTEKSGSIISSYRKKLEKKLVRKFYGVRLSRRERGGT